MIKLRLPSLPIQIIIGAVFGVFTGILLGDLCSTLLPISDGYTMLLEVAAYPYIICTLLSSLGQLTPRLSLRIFKNGWIIYCLLILATFGVLIILAHALPAITTSLKTVSAPAKSENFLMLVIPSNLFAALSNNYVPAVVLFCILFGFMLQRVKNEGALFKILNTISSACEEFWHWLVKFAPIGVFASLAYISGTMRAEQFKDLSEFIILCTVGSILLTFWLIPSLICSLTNIRYRALLYQLRTALLLAGSTTVAILALPYIKDAAKKLLAQKNIVDKESKDIIETTLVISYPLGHLGNFFIYLFILFASLYFNQPLTHWERFLLPFSSYFSSIGSYDTVINAIGFLSGWLQLPQDTSSLFDTVSVITHYGEVLASVMGFSFLTILVTFACYGQLKVRWRMFFTHIVLIAVLLTAFAYLFKNSLPDPSMKIYERINNYSIPLNQTKGVKVSFLPPFDEVHAKPAAPTQDLLFRIQQSGVLRVGYNPNDLPFSFFNSKGELVGYDVANMYALAQSMKVRLEFIPYSWDYLISDLQSDKFDLAIGGIWVSASRLQDADFSDSYLKIPLSFIVPKANEADFSTASQILSKKNLRLGSFKDSMVEQFAAHNLPNAKIIVFPNLLDQLHAAFINNEIDAAIWDQAGANVWVLGHPNYIAVVPQGLAAPYLMAYMVQKNSEQFVHFLNYWLELKKTDGFEERINNRWILGRSLGQETPRWSIIRNVFHWQKETTPTQLPADI
jgi:Na+/H+-dicarboxylate symporter/ABC-type amino acid transport substrate-binding protein